MPLAESALERHTTSATGRRYYARAPIQEALLDVGVVLRGPITSDILVHVRDGLDTPYPETSTMVEWEAGMTLQPIGEPRAESRSRIVGQEFRNPDLNEVIRARVDGFSYHRLAPYSRWEDWTPRAFASWDQYVAIADPTQISRVSVRYINRINLPNKGELKEYLLTAPEVAPALPQAISGYAMQLTMPRPEPHTFTIIRQTMVPAPRPDLVTILFDIEIVRPRMLSPEREGLSAVARELHEIEIETFERCITNRTRELID